MGYFGSKATSGLCQALIALMPPHSVYIESHLGGGALMKRKPTGVRSIGIDRDAQALEAFACDYPVELVHGCAHAFLALFPFLGPELVYSDPPYLDVVVHLAAMAKGDATWEEVLSHNIVGTYNVFEAARIAGVKRIISASSGATVSGSEREMPYRALVEGRYDEITGWEKLDASVVRPSGLYGCSKLWGEALARHFSDAWGLSMICLRIGMVNQDDRPTSTREFSVWCSQRDITQMVQRCIDAPHCLTFATFYAVSDNKWSYRSLDNARRELGFEPRDQAEQHR